MTFTPRERMVYSAVQLVRARGATGTGVRDVVEHAKAPRGSFQHYFPGGKDQLVSEAVLWAADFAAEQTRVFEQDKLRARKVTLDEWKNRSLSIRLMETLTSPFHPHL